MMGEWVEADEDCGLVGCKNQLLALVDWWRRVGRQRGMLILVE